ncbi:MAG TPA: TRAP transporter small permease [Alphaproteobacteria bacterium]
MTAARVYDAFYALLGFIAAALIALIALIISFDVIMRNLGLGTLPWMLEASEYAQFLATFLGAPWVLKHGAHVRVDVVLSNLPGRTALALELIGDVIGLLSCTVILYYALSIAATSMRDGALIIKILIIPEWWVFGVVAFSAVLLIIEFICRIWRARSAAPPRSVAPL